MAISQFTNTVGERNAPDVDRSRIEARLFTEVGRCVNNVIWNKLGERKPDLRQNIVGEIALALPTFRGESSFSTWVQSVAQNMIKEELRSTKRARFPVRLSESHLSTSEGGASLLRQLESRFRISLGRS